MKAQVLSLTAGLVVFSVAATAFLTAHSWLTAPTTLEYRLDVHRVPGVSACVLIITNLASGAVASTLLRQEDCLPRASTPAAAPTAGHTP